jgi:hypothetical protein
LAARCWASTWVSLPILRARMLARWAGWAGFNQGDILATAVPGFPVFDLAGFVGSSPWGVGVIALGAAVLRRPVRHPAEDPAATRPTTVAAEPAPGT